jgi:acetylornithine deacetylase/succinyl-diaminopimelate desuccinylase-like protein
MGRAIAHVSDVKPPEGPKATFTVGVVSGGTSVNTIASDAKMLVDIRSNSAESLVETEKLIMNAIEQGVAEENARWSSTGIRFDAKLLGDRPAGLSSPDSPVTQAVLQSWKALGLAEPVIDAASTDSNVPINLGIPAATVSGGGEGGGVHGPGEWYKPVDSHRGPQTLLLTTLMLAGVENLTSPRLPVRER